MTDGESMTDGERFPQHATREKWCATCRRVLVSDRNTCPGCGLTLMDAKAAASNGEQPRVWWPAAEKPK